MLLKFDQTATVLMPDTMGLEGINISGSEWKKIKESWMKPDPQWMNTIIIVNLSVNPSGDVSIQQLMEFQEDVHHKLYTTVEGLRYLKSVCGLSL